MGRSLAACLPCAAAAAASTTTTTIAAAGDASVGLGGYRCQEGDRITSRMKSRPGCCWWRRKSASSYQARCYNSGYLAGLGADSQPGHCCFFFALVIFSPGLNFNRGAEQRAAMIAHFSAFAVMYGNGQHGRGRGGGREGGRKLLLPSSGGDTRAQAPHLIGG